MKKLTKVFAILLLIAIFVTIELLPAFAAKKTVRMFAQALTPRERLEADRWNPPQYFWKLEEDYEADHPDVDIDFLKQIAGEYEAWLVTQMTGGISPEIVWYQRGYINRDYKKGWFVNLSPWLDKPSPYVEGNEHWIDTFQGPVIASGTAPDGNIYLITGDIVGTGVFYNVDLFKELGFTVPVPHGVTWEEFIDMQKKIKENTDVAPFALDMGASSMRTDWTLRVLQDVLLDDKLGAIKGIEGYVERTWKPGEPITMEETVRAIKKGVYSAKDPAWQEQLRLLKEWSQYFEKGFLAGPDVYRLYITGKAAMTWDGSWSIKPIDVDPLREFEYGIFPHFPKITSETSPYVKRDILPPAMAGVGGVFQYAVAAESEKRGVLNESVDWMMYITAPQNIVPLLNDQTSFAPGIKNPENVDPRLGVFVDMMVEAGVERLEPYDSMLTRDFFDKFYKLVQQYVGGKLDMEQVTDEIQKEMEIAADLIIKEHPEWEAENW